MNPAGKAAMGSGIDSPRPEFDLPPILKSRFFLAACLIVAVLICYAPAMGAGFVWDDDLLVTENPLVQNSDSLPYIWASSAATDYTPLTTTTFWLQWRLWGDNAAGYHLVNILLHALSALLLWRVLARLAVPGAWLGALFFAIHPVNVASVAWIAELKNALSLPLYLGAIAAFLRFLESRKPGPYLVALAAAACALLAKGSTVILPGILFLCIWWRQQRISWRDLLALVPFGILSAGAAAATIHFQRRVIDLGVAPLPMAARIARAGQAIWFYLGKDVWPVNLCAVYPKWALDGSYLPLAAALLPGLGLWLARRRIGRGPFFAWACFVVALLPVLGIVDMTFLDQAYVADWWQQLALPAVVVLVAANLALHWNRDPATGKRAGVGAVIAIILLFLGVQTWSEASGYESMEIHCRRTLAENPHAWIAHNNLGGVLSAEGKLDEAAAEFQAALRLKPTDASAHSNLGVIDARQHHYDDAIAQYHAALNVEDSAKTWFNLGNSLRAERRNPEAVDAFSHAIDDDARWPAPRYEKGTILLEMGQSAEAGHEAQTLVALDPAGISGHYLLARAAAAIGRFDAAVAESQTALDIARQSGQQDVIQRMQDVLDACKAGRIPPAPER
jgi:tetratricopeptide (TPR) repeat protein